MKKTLLLLTLLIACVTMARPPRNVRPDAGLHYIDSHFHLYDSLQKQIHGFAETGYNEHRSADLLCRHLEQHGFRVERSVAGIPTAFIATYGKGGPVIGVMAEYDALPGMAQDTVPRRQAPEGGGAGHACGHNLLGVGAAAGAVAVSKWLAEGHSGTICLFGCPAEEGGGGKAYMMREGCFEGLDVMFDWHPDTRNTVNIQTGLANVQVRFTFHGHSAHASGAPDEGRSALDAVEAFDYMMNLMREHVPQTARIHYVITDGGRAPNIVPDRAEVLYYLRSPQRAVVLDLLARALKAAEGAALGTGTAFEYEIMSGNYERLPNTMLSEVIYRYLEQVGGVRYDAREQTFAREILRNSGIADTTCLARIAQVELPSGEGIAAWVSSDVGNVTWGVPTGSFRIASFVPAGSGHCWQQTASGGTTIGTKGALNAARVICLSACELYTQPETLECIHREFLERRGPGFRFEPLMGNRLPPLNYNNE